jgi:diguanylate cyclase (GGDEF)-like protein
LRTALLFGVLATWLTGAVLLLSWRSLPDTVRPSLRWWLAGLALHPLGFLLLALRGELPSWLTGPTSATVLAVAFACMAVALRNFYGLPERRERLAVVVLAVAVAGIWFSEVQPSLQGRIASLNLLVAVLLGSGARAVFRHGGPRGRVPRITGAIFATVTALVLLRAGLELAWPDVAPAAAAPHVPLPSSLVNLVSAAAMLLLPPLSTVGFVLMCAERSQEQLALTARMDFLTGIFNRRAIEDLAARAISASRRHGVPVSILVVDLDHFKHVNDEHGHECGDNALVESVRRMRESLRSEDLIGRQGGEEFVVVMPDIDLASAHAAAERLRLQFSDRPMRIHDGEREVEAKLTVSVGVAALEPADQQFSNLLRRADRAMYAAKAAGRNRVMVDVHEG